MRRDCGGGAALLVGVVFFSHGTHTSSAWAWSMASMPAISLHPLRTTPTQVVAEGEGRTVLYVPEEGLRGLPPSELARCKDVTQRLESALLHWTRQVKEVLAQSDAPAGLAGGLLAEVGFWRKRASDLGGIVAQLAAPDAAQLLAVLDAAGSPYLGPFLGLQAATQAAAGAAASTLRCLALLEVPAQELEGAAIGEVGSLLPRLLACLRFVWEHSEAYGHPDRLVGLLRHLGAQVMARCAAAVQLEQLWGSELSGVSAALAQAIATGER